MPSFCGDNLDGGTAEQNYKSIQQYLKRYEYHQAIGKLQMIDCEKCFDKWHCTMILSNSVVWNSLHPFSESKSTKTRTIIYIYIYSNCCCGVSKSATSENTNCKWTECEDPVNTTISPACCIVSASHSGMVQLRYILFELGAPEFCSVVSRRKVWSYIACIISNRGWPPNVGFVCHKAFINSRNEAVEVYQG